MQGGGRKRHSANRKQSADIFTAPFPSYTHSISPPFLTSKLKTKRVCTFRELFLGLCLEGIILEGESSLKKKICLNYVLFRYRAMVRFDCYS